MIVLVVVRASRCALTRSTAASRTCSRWSQAAVRWSSAGGNPYGIGYPESFPPGAPYAYGPIALAWYWLAVEVAQGASSCSLACGMVAILGVRGRVLGLGIYAVLAPLLVTAADGSNDTSAGIVLLIALLVAQRSPIAGGFLLAIAAAFKPYAAAWLPPLMAYGGVVWPLLAFVLGQPHRVGPGRMWWRPGNILEVVPRGGRRARRRRTTRWAG